MAVEALILVRPFPGKADKVVSRIARGLTEDSREYEYHDKAIKRVYRATGEYSIIVYISTEKDLDDIFRLANEFARPCEPIKMNASGSQGSIGGSGTSGGGSGETDVAGTQVIILCPKPANDP
jgi:hypothetical protein